MAIPQILVVEDDAQVRNFLRRLFRLNGMQAVFACTVQEALETITRSTPFDVVLLDMHLPDGQGTELLPLLASHSPQTSTLVLSGATQPHLMQQALQMGAADCIEKPFELDLLLQRIHGLLLSHAS